MTHTTRFRFPAPIDPERLFGSIRTTLGIPADQPFDVDFDWDHANVRSLRSKPGGFMAMVWLDVCPSGEPRCADGYSHESASGHVYTHKHRCLDHWNDEACQHGEDNCPIESCEANQENWFAELMLDTSYGASTGCLLCFHRKVVRDTLSGFDESYLYSWHNEYDDTWHDDPSELCPNHHNHQNEMEHIAALVFGGAR